MSYQVIARKWRPQSFADVVGQQHVTRTLANALRTGRVAHAYAEPGKQIGVYAYRNSTNGAGIAFISISGYLADL